MNCDEFLRRRGVKNGKNVQIFEIRFFERHLNGKERKISHRAAHAHACPCDLHASMLSVPPKHCFVTYLHLTTSPITRFTKPQPSNNNDRSANDPAHKSSPRRNPSFNSNSKCSTV
eukprot:scaffold17904_cov142-Skeletonema_marinoi.AAC.12